MTGYRTILADPPWEQPLGGRRRRGKGGYARALPYPTMSLEAIKALPIGSLSGPESHCWLWVTNAYLRAGFDVLDAWGFRYLAPITWVKPSGIGNWFAHRTQHLLFGYRGRLQMQARYLPTVIEATPPRHSEKPEASYRLIERVSFPARVEVFARRSRQGWDAWGNEVAPSPEAVRVLGAAA